ncbi:MAG: hypothetical protein ABI673_01465 [Novosphingobium sp.]
MSTKADRQKRGGITPAMLISGAVALLALPSAVLAFASGFDSHQALPAPAIGNSDSISTFTTSSVDPRLARQISVSSLPKGHVFRFTPAGTATRPDRSVTVAVRVDPALARVIGTQKGAAPLALSPTSALRIAPNAYNLGVARGFQSFSQGLTLPAEIRKIDMPDLSAFQPSSGAKDAPSRFSPRIALDEREKTGRAPRTLEGGGAQTVDLGGSYRLTGNLNVTAGVRYSQERDRIVAPVDGRKDGQAVYVGTQFRF